MITEYQLKALSNFPTWKVKPKSDFQLRFLKSFKKKYQEAVFVCRSQQLFSAFVCVCPVYPSQKFGEGDSSIAIFVHTFESDGDLLLAA